MTLTQQTDTLTEMIANVDKRIAVTKTRYTKHYNNAHYAAAMTLLESIDALQQERNAYARVLVRTMSNVVLTVSVSCK